MPKERKDKDAGGEGEQIKGRHAAERVMNVGDGLLKGGDAE